MKAIKDFDKIEAAADLMDLLEPGAYIVKIIRINDYSNEEKPYLEVVYDVLHNGKYIYEQSGVNKNLDRDWLHAFRFYLHTDGTRKRYKRFIENVENSPENKGYKYENVDGAEKTLVGKFVGFVVCHRFYTAHDGTDREALNLSTTITTTQVKNGDFSERLLKPQDTRQAPTLAQAQQQVQQQAPQGMFNPPRNENVYADEEIPF